MRASPSFASRQRVTVKDSLVSFTGSAALGDKLWKKAYQTISKRFISS